MSPLEVDRGRVPRIRAVARSVDVRAILDMARDVAHGVDRPAAPLTAYLLGLAVGQGHPLAAAAARISDLAAGWDPDRDE